MWGQGFRGGRPPGQSTLERAPLGQRLLLLAAKACNVRVCLWFNDPS